MSATTMGRDIDDSAQTDTRSERRCVAAHRVLTVIADCSDRMIVPT
jgi:hypothetical protein